MIIRARAPLRISFGGGGTDVSPYSEEMGGVVLSSTIAHYAYGSLSPRSDGQIGIHSLDFDVLVKYDVKEKQRIEGELGLVKAVIRRMLPEQDSGLDLFIHCDAPPGSGLGSSGAIGAMMVGLLGQYLHLSLTAYETADLAYRIEREDLGVPGGKQDQYAAVFGGVNLIEFQPHNTVVNPLRVDPWILQELEYHLLLCYTSKKHYSGDLIDKQVGFYRDGRKDTLAAMSEMKDITRRMKDALLQGQLAQFAELLHWSGECKKRMNPLITNDEIEGLYAIARRHGVVGGKILGAGGGGYLLLYCPFERKHLVASALENAGGKVVSFHLDSEGLRIWRARKDMLGEDLSL